MMKIGFQLNGGTRRKKIIEDRPEEDHKKENILHIEGNVLQTDSIHHESSNSNQPLIIPLPPPRNSAPSLVVPTKNEDQLSLDDIAARELLADLKGTSTNDGANALVIEAIKPKETVSAPLLLANVPPELLNLTNDDERFQVDVSLRAENVDVNSEVYQSIPIDQFGAAMLRGMGWTGPSPDEIQDDKKYQVVPRESRLGLGATPKPPDEKKKSKIKPGEDAKAKEKEQAKNSWKKKAEDHIENQKLYVDDVVWLLAPVELSGSRGIIVQATGVPGINKIRVSLEKDGSDVIIDKRDLLLVTDSELKEKPFKRVFIQPEVQKNDSDDRNQTQRERREGNQDRDRDRDREREREKEKKKSSKTNKRDRDQDDRDSEKDSSKKQKSDRERDASQGGPGSGRDSEESSWLQNGIRVKIVSKKIDDQGRYYLSKGTVVDVYYPSSSSSSSSSSKSRERGSSSSSKVASIRLDNNVVLQDIKEKYLETVLPKNIGDICMILTGPHRGLTGSVMEKDFDRNEVTVQLTEEMEIVLLSMDSVAALA